MNFLELPPVPGTMRPRTHNGFGAASCAKRVCPMARHLHGPQEPASVWSALRDLGQHIEEPVGRLDADAGDQVIVDLCRSPVLDGREPGPQTAAGDV